MKILHVITRLILGGAQQNTLMCCQDQVAAGHRVWLAFGPIYGPEGTMLPDAQGSGAQVVCVRSLRRAVLPVHDVVCYKSLRSLIQRIDPDVVHTHSSKAGILGRAAAWYRQTPAVIHTIHGLPFHDRQHRMVRRAFIVAERWAARRCHKLVGITAAMCTAFAEQRIGRNEQYEVVPSGVDPARFQQPTVSRESARQAHGIPADVPVVGTVARLDPLKGHEDLLDILPELTRRHPRLRVLFVGDGYHRSVLQRRIADEGMAEHVTLTGLVPPLQMASLYRALDVAVLASYQEGQGRTLVEAQLCGCAVVGYDVGGIGEVCDRGRAGRLVSCGDRASLIGAIDNLLADPQSREQLAQAGQAHASMHFTRQLMVERLQRIYTQVLEQEQPAASSQRRAAK